MSNEEKVMAIWKYFEQNTKYDDAACKAAEASNFQDVSGYADSFNTYGIMCNKVGVCQSYSYCYKLLLDACGIQSISLTGFLNKTLPHAWNAILLDNKWYWIDATNNLTNSGIPYMLYQTSSEYALSTDYLLDNEYDIDDNLDYVLNDDNSKDWYVSHNMFATSNDELLDIIDNSYQKGVKTWHLMEL